MKKPDILAALEPVVEALEKIGVPYYIAGSICSSAFGIARATLDIDLVSDLKMEHVDILVGMLEHGFYMDDNMIRDAIGKHSSFNLIHLDTMLKVDVFVAEDTPYGREIFFRKKRDTLEETAGAKEFYFASPEDIILNKLIWFRKGEGVSDRQWNDVLGVIKVQAGLLDDEYLRRWAAELAVLELLEKALEEAGA